MGKEKEKIGIEKLIELLNEYEAKRHKTSIVAEIRKQKGDRLSYLEMNWNYSELLCISKGYDFIKRLLENKKIDTEKLHKKETELDICITFHDEYDGFISDYYRQLLMLLSIQDEPIEFLVSILK